MTLPLTLRFPLGERVWFRAPSRLRRLHASPYPAIVVKHNSASVEIEIVGQQQTVSIDLGYGTVRQDRQPVIWTVPVKENRLQRRALHVQGDLLIIKRVAKDRVYCA